MLPAALFPIGMFIAGAAIGNTFVNDSLRSTLVALVAGLGGIMLMIGMASVYQTVPFLMGAANTPALVLGLFFPPLVRYLTEASHLSSD